MIAMYILLILFEVILRDCPPGSPDYKKEEVLRHLAQMDCEDIKKFLGHEFSLFDIDKEGVVTKENFFTDFVPAVWIESRKNNIQSLRDGLTLKGK